MIPQGLITQQNAPNVTSISSGTKAALPTSPLLPLEAQIRMSPFLSSWRGLTFARSTYWTSSRTSFPFWMLFARSKVTYPLPSSALRSSPALYVTPRTYSATFPPASLSPRQIGVCSVCGNLLDGFVCFWLSEARMHLKCDDEAQAFLAFSSPNTEVSGR